MKTPTNLPIDNPAWPLVLAGISYWGITDNDGNVAGTTLRCAGLATEPSYRNQKVKILSGPVAGQTKDIVTHPSGTDTITATEAFTNPAGAAQQILTGTLFVIISDTPAIAEVHGVFIVIPSAPETVEPDTNQDLSIAISTVEGIPLAAALTAGTITITRVRAGVETVIVNAVACAVANGRIFYNYLFPAANWQAGDEYKAVFTGQQVTVGATTYPLSDTRCKGRISREAAGIIAALINSGLAFRGEVTAAVPAANQFTIATLAGFGDTAFVDWTAYVFWDTGGLDLPPQRESQAIATYASAAGIFTTAPFTAPVNVGDIIIILHPRIAEILGIITQTNRLAGGENTGTHNHANNVNWQTVVTIDPAGLRRKVHSIWMNFVNLTQNTTWRLSYNYGGLGVYEEFTSNAIDPWTPAMANGVLIDCRAVIGHELRLEIQSQVLEGAPRDVPYEVYWEQME